MCTGSSYKKKMPLSGWHQTEALQLHDYHFGHCYAHFTTEWEEFQVAKKQSSGLYRTKVKIGVDLDGNEIVKWVSGKTKKELEEEKQKVIRHYISGDGMQADVLFGVYAKKWFGIKTAELSASSIQSYRTALNKDILPVFGPRKMRAVKPSELQEYLSQYASMSATKITMIKATLDGIFEMACVDRIIKENPMEHVRKPAAAEAKEKRALTEQERETIQRVAAEHPKGAYLAAMYYLGARPGEVRGLQWGDFDWQAGYVCIQRDIDYKDGGSVGELKTKQSRRIVPVPPDLKEILWPLRAMPGMFVFRGVNSGSALAKTTAERMWVELMCACGLVRPVEEGENRYPAKDIRSKYVPLITPHVLRHNYVTLCWENGIDVYMTQKLVGHKSIKTTMDIYTHLSDKQLERAKIEVEGMFSRNEKNKKVAQKLHNLESGEV